MKKLVLWIITGVVLMLIVAGLIFLIRSRPELKTTVSKTILTPTPDPNATTYEVVESPEPFVCDVFRQGSPREKSVGCGYEWIPNFGGKPGNIIRVVRLVGVTSLNNDRYIEVEREKEGRWIREKIYIGDITDTRERTVLISKEPTIETAVDFVEEKDLDVEGVYQFLKQHVGEEVVVHIYPDKRNVTDDSKNYVLIMTVLYKK